MQSDEATCGVILTVGITHEPVVFCLQQLKADFAAFICTPQSRETLDRVLETYPLKPSHYRVCDIDDAPEEIGHLIGEFHTAFLWLRHECDVDHERIFADPTPGRKWMSAGSTMIGSFLGLNLFYTDAKYVAGKLDPSTMRFVRLGNAYDQTGFLTAEKGRELFNRFDYLSAKEAFAHVRPTLSPQADLFNGLQHLCETLHRWDLFEHYQTSLAGELDTAIKTLARCHNSKITPPGFSDFLEQLDQLRKSIEQVTTCSKPDLLATVDLMCNAERRIARGRYDDAAARTYRALESLSQLYLRTRHGIRVDEPDYECLDPSQRQAIQDQLEHLPEKISLENGWRILWALDDPAAEHIFISRGKKLSNKFAGILDARNNSILAHGWNPVGRAQATKMLNKFRELMLSIEGDNAREAIQRLCPPKLPAFFERNDVTQTDKAAKQE